MSVIGEPAQPVDATLYLRGRNRGLGNIDAELEQLTMDLGRSPERVLETDPPNKITHLFVDPRPATATVRYVW
jgi:hypothetical protein